ncbi:MAG: hypothetical protein ABIW79_09495, partial [Gemmatimonas sp.]
MTRTTLSVAFLGAVLLLAMARTQGSAAAVVPARTVTESFAGNSRRMLVPGSDTTPLYTEEQATNGTAIFKKVCVECHEPADY